MLFGSKGLPSHPELEIVEGDIRDTASYAAAVKGCDYVIHMACIRMIRASSWTGP